MKYIRTKDGRIIDLTDKDYIVNGNDLILHEQYEEVGGMPCKKGSMVQLSVAIITQHNEYNFIGTIEKQADTIDRLCDVFVLKDKTEIKVDESGEYKYRYATRYNGFRTLHQVLMEHTIYEDTEIYGAIWTDRGLIYVAKMNEKGELELL